MYPLQLDIYIAPIQDTYSEVLSALTNKMMDVIEYVTI